MSQTSRCFRLYAVVAVSIGPLACSSTTDAPPAQVASVSVSASDSVLTAGDSLKFSAEGLTSSGQLVSGRSVQWASSDTTKATVSPSGFVLGRTEGNLTISATIESVTSSRTLRIRPTLGVSEPISPRGRLLFARDGRIATMKFDGSDIRYLTGSHGQFAVSADGNWIAYNAATELIVMKSDGTGRKTIATNVGFLQPSWIPDGTAVVVQEETTAGNFISTYTRDGGRLASFSIDDTFGQPRGTGGRLLRGVTSDGRVLLWKTSPANGDIVTLTRGGSEIKILGNGERPRLSPDGTKVSYACSGVCVVNTDGTGGKKVWSEGTLETWISPNNQRIAFPCGNGSICVTTIDGVLVSALSSAQSGGASLQLAWSANGETLYYRCQFVTGGGNFVSTRNDLCKVNVDNSNFSNLLNDANDDARPTIVETVGQSKH